MEKYHLYSSKSGKAPENAPDYKGFNSWLGDWEVMSMRLSNFTPNNMLTVCSKQVIARNFVTMLMYGK